VEAVLDAMTRPDLVGGALDPDPLAVEAALPAAAPVEAPAPADAPRPAPAGRGLAVASVLATAGAWVAYALDAPLVPRVALVLAAVLVLPSVALGRRIAASGPLVRGVVGAAGVVAFDVLAAEALLYAHGWSPGWFLVIASTAGCALASRPVPVRPADHRPVVAVPVLDLRPVASAEPAEARR
jgi:hypothetical protein